MASVARGHTNAEIAGVLGISPLTVKWHVSEILHKLGVSLALLAYALGHLEGIPNSGGATRQVAG